MTDPVVMISVVVDAGVEGVRRLPFNLFGARGDESRMECRPALRTLAWSTSAQCANMLALEDPSGPHFHRANNVISVGCFKLFLNLFTDHVTPESRVIFPFAWKYK